MFWDLFKRLFIALTITISIVMPVKSEDFNSYMADVNEKLQDLWTPPEGVIEGHADVVFKLDKTGDLLYYHLIQKSGDTKFDKSVVEALKKCPFNEFPHDSKQEYITINYSFDLHIADTDKMQKYAELAERYYNSDKHLALKYLDMAIDEIQGNSLAYFLYARRCKINNELGNKEAANNDLAEFSRLKALHDEKRIKLCRQEANNEKTPYAYFTLANAYEAAGDFDNALISINQAISMTPLNNAYKRYRAELIMRHDKEIN